MKINIFSIFVDHLKTLKSNEAHSKEKLCGEDFLIFFLLPIIIAIATCYYGTNLDKETYGISISVFSIFTALLLNVQIALFAVYQRAWTSLKDKNLDEIQQSEINLRNDLLREVNTNISYLIILSCFAVTIFLIFYMTKTESKFASSISFFIYIHFLFTLLMVIKRAHALFSKEYTK